MTKYDTTHDPSDSAFMGKDMYIVEMVRKNKLLSLLEDLDKLINDLEVYDLEVIDYR